MQCVMTLRCHFSSGLLGCVSEIWLRGRLPDLAIIPISISYDRTLEEKLYAYELLGIPKPPESTSVSKKRLDCGGALIRISVRN